MSEQARVLIVEDSEADRALLDAHLSRDGFDTEFACDGVEAWQMLDANPTATISSFSTARCRA